MHSNETICKKNPAEQSMCAQSAFSIRNRPPKKRKNPFCVFHDFQDPMRHFSFFLCSLKARKHTSVSKNCDMQMTWISWWGNY